MPGDEFINLLQPDLGLIVAVYSAKSLFDVPLLHWKLSVARQHCLKSPESFLDGFAQKVSIALFSVQPLCPLCLCG